MDDIPKVSFFDLVFPHRHKALLPKWGDLTEAEQRMEGPFCRAALMLFLRGGKITDHGLKLKPGVDADKLDRYLRATLRDWGPSQEHKIGGVGHMLAKWCEVV